MAKTKTNPLILGADGEPLSAPALPAVRERVEQTPSMVAIGVADAMAIVERLCLNKDMDPAKLGPILDFAERIMDRTAKAQFDAAFVEMQADLPEITKDGRIVVKEKDIHGKRTGADVQNTPYAKWPTIMKVIRPILHQHGFALNHRSERTPDGRLRVTAVLRGHGYVDERCSFDLEADGTGSKNNAQAWASSLSYAKRHTACAVLNITTREEDDDGKSSGAPMMVGTPMTEAQRDQIIDLCEAVGCAKDQFLHHLNNVRPKGHPPVTGLAVLPAERFDEAIAALRNYEAKRKEREAASKGGDR